MSRILRSRLLVVLVAAPLVFFASTVRAQSPATQPGLDVSRLELIAPLVNDAIAAKWLPGAVVMVGRGDQVFYQQAFGRRAVEPVSEPMTLDTIFDVASLTKVVATTTCVMALVEDGKLRLNDRVATYIPGFERYHKGTITIRHLLTHESGLRPDLDMSLEFTGTAEAIARAVEEVPTSPPGHHFVYSDINFYLLGEIVHRISGQPLEDFARKRVFEPLGMKDTMFLPPSSLLPRIAPTERCTPLGWPCDKPGAKPLRGIVHDPTARRMGGVAGHAGLFSTAADLAIFCRALLHGGAIGGARILSPLTVAKMTTPVPLGGGGLRGLGWDIDTAYSSNRGELMPIGSFGHTGFTGTSIWIDPLTGTWIVFLSNRVHPDGKGDVTPLRARVASVVGSSVIDPPAQALRTHAMTGIEPDPSGPNPAPAWRQPVLNGIDALRADGFKALKGRKVGLVTNNTGMALDGQSTIDLLAKADGVTLVALFSPEHGIRGQVDEQVASSKDEKTGLPIHSLYGETMRPTPQMLQGIDTLVFDIQDIGVRLYTYETTLAYLMEEAAKAKIKVVVLDRVNPVNGFAVEGPTLDKTMLGFVGYFPMPVRHGLTIGELAKLYNGENKIGCELTVIPVKHWQRAQWFDETGIPWVNTSPNMRNLNEATLYPGIGAIEATNISVGRGTDTPFEHLGAPWMDGTKLAAALNAREIPGIRFYPTSFTPTGSKYKGELCRGIFMVITDREALHPVRVGIEVAAALYRLHGDQFTLDQAARLVGSKTTIARIKAGEDPAAVAASWNDDEARWRLLRAKYLLY